MEELIPFLVVIAYLVLSILGRLGKSRKQGEVESESQSQPTGTGVEQMLQEMMRQAGMPEEQPVASERRPTASEHRPTASEHRPTASETRRTLSEHRQTLSETRPTPSEHVPRASEHLPTASEHLKGDAALPPIPELPPVSLIPTGRKRRRRSPFASALAADVHGGARSLARAIVLREILGPPVALRRQDDGV